MKPHLAKNECEECENFQECPSGRLGHVKNVFEVTKLSTFLTSRRQISYDPQIPASKLQHPQVSDLSYHQENLVLIFTAKIFFTKSRSALSNIFLIMPKSDDNPDYYSLLGLPRTASPTEIKRTYRRLALKYHPDKNRDNIEEATAIFKKLAEAYEVLSNEQLRAEYDACGTSGSGYATFFAGGGSGGKMRSSDEVFHEVFGFQAEEQSPACEQEVPVHWRPLDPIRLFNLPLFEMPLLIDTRRPGEFENCHVRGSLSLPVDDVETTDVVTALHNFLASFEREWGPEHFRGGVIVVGEDGENPSPQTITVLEELQKLMRETALASSSPPDHSAASAECSGGDKDSSAHDSDLTMKEHFQCLIAKLRREKKKELFLLKNLKQFAHEYPGCVWTSPSSSNVADIEDAEGVSTDNDANTASAPPRHAIHIPLTPAHIHDHVFLGDRQLLRGHCEDMLLSCRIDCVLLGTKQEEAMVRRVIQGSGKLMLEKDEIAVGGTIQRDSTAEDIEPPPTKHPIELLTTHVNPLDVDSYQQCWDECARYIDDCGQRGKRVLVLLNDRHQSSAVVLWWLRTTMELRSAARLLRERCPRIDWRVAYAEQVVAMDAEEGTGGGGNWRRS